MISMLSFSRYLFMALLTKRAAIQILLNIVRTLSHRLRDANVKSRANV